MAFTQKLFLIMPINISFATLYMVVEQTLTIILGMIMHYY